MSGRKTLPQASNVQTYEKFSELKKSGQSAAKSRKSRQRIGPPSSEVAKKQDPSQTRTDFLDDLDKITKRAE